MEIPELYEIYKEHPSICTDTRKVENGDLFFALKGDHFDGNKFAKDALNKGAFYAVVDDSKYALSNKYVLVDDVLKTLQELANFHRKKLTIPVIGITGSNGKTTTKELIHHVLKTQFKAWATKGNLNNHIGVPLTLLSIPNDTEIAIIEMGANHVGEIDFLCHIAEPNFGIITNIGTAHIEGFGSAENVKVAKSELYQFIEKNKDQVFVNVDDDVLMELSANINRITYGENKADCAAKLVQVIPEIVVEWNNTKFSSPLYGKYNFQNIMAAICIGQHFKVPHEFIMKAIESYRSTNNRSQVLKIGSNTVFLDAYNANPTSMNAAIETFASHPSESKLMILGDMLELGGISKEEHQKIIDKAKSLEIDAIFVGKEFSASSNPYQFIFLKDVSSVVDWMKHTGITNHHILIKGSRGIQLEKIVKHMNKL